MFCRRDHCQGSGIRPRRGYHGECAHDIFADTLNELFFRHARLFEQAADVLQKSEATTARLNAALLRLMLNEAEVQPESGSSTKTIAVPIPQADDPALAADLALEQAAEQLVPHLMRFAVRPMAPASR